MPDDPLDRGIGIAADVDRRTRLLDGLGPQIGRLDVDVLTVVFGGLLGPQRLDRLDAFVEQRTAGLGVGAVIAHLLEIPARADA